MLSKKRVTLPALIKYVLSITTEPTNNTDSLESVFNNKSNNHVNNQVKSNDEFKFNCLKFGESKNINDFPEKLKNIFDPFIKDFIRYGSRVKFDESEANLSLYYSIAMHVVKNFKTLSSKDQLNYIHKLRDKIIIFLSNEETFKQLEYDKMGWNKKDIINSFVTFTTNSIVLKVIADYLNINIFLLNIMEDKIYVVSENESYDMFRSNIFITFYENTFEPTIYLDNLTLDYNTIPIKKIITVDKNFLLLWNTNFNNKTQINFSIKLSNITKYIKKIPENKVEPVKISDDNVDVVENEYGEVTVEDSEVEEAPETKLVFHISPKMKKDELQQIAQKLGLDIEKNGAKKKVPKTNGELIAEINAKLKAS